MQFGEYIRSIGNAANTILEGMAVTFSHLFREPITIQYPDRLELPISEILPERYRGFLEVQMDICTGCSRCMRVCPIDCIAIDLEKNAETKKKEMVRFDIDMGKCMYCGLCVDVCKTESTGAIRHTKEFEAATDNFGTLTFRFIEPGDSFPLFKAPKDKGEIPLGTYGPWAREARERAMRDNPGRLEQLTDLWIEEVDKRRKAAEDKARKAAEAKAKKEAAAKAKAEEEAKAKAEAEAAEGDEDAKAEEPKADDKKEDS